MDCTNFNYDIREDPGVDHYRKKEFKTGWNRAVRGRNYAEDTLTDLTWDNLGWRLGKLFGETPDDMFEEMYDWCERHYYFKKENPKA